MASFSPVSASQTFGRLTPFSPRLTAQNGPPGLSFSESFGRPPIRPKVENPVFAMICCDLISPSSSPHRSSAAPTTRSILPRRFALGTASPGRGIRQGMGRLAQPVAVGMPHYITRRCNRARLTRAVSSPSSACRPSFDTTAPDGRGRARRRKPAQQGLNEGQVLP